MDGHARFMNMTRQELEDRIAEITHLYQERYNSAMAQWYYEQIRCSRHKKVVISPQPQKSHYMRLAQMSIDKTRKEYLMQSFPVRIGDMVEVIFGEHKVGARYLRVQRIEVGGVQNLTLKFTGKWFKNNGEEYIKQPNWWASQNSISRYGPNIKNLQPIINNEQDKDKN